MDTDTGYQYTDPQNNQRKKKILAIILAIIALAIGAAVAIALSGDRNSSGGAGNGETAAAETCVEEQCFKEKFYTCQPATYELIEEEEDIIGYEILESTETGCWVSLEYLNSADPELAGRGMACNFENELGFISGTTQVLSYPQEYECEGELTEYL